MKQILMIAFLMTSLFVKGQETGFCGTQERTDDEIKFLPWYGNNEYLDEILEEVDKNMARDNESRNGEECGEIEDYMLIPIQFWIYQENETDIGVPSDFQLQRMMDELNRIYQSNGMMVRFYMVCPQFIIDPDALNMNDVQAVLNQFGASDNSSINIHIIEDLEGAAGTYYSLGDFIVIQRDAYQNLEGTSTLAHEIGHYFGLDHTHRNSTSGRCRQEAVSRSRTFTVSQFFTCFGKAGTICDKNGDALCDTPADPGLAEEFLGDKVDPGCIYSLGETDRWGDTYVPNTRNVMSASDRICRDFFSLGQTGIMWWSILWSGSRNFIAAVDRNIIDPDQYEPDDSSFRGVPRVISLGEKQCHSFHNIQISECIDEVDWLRIDNSNQLIGRYIIEINEVDGFTNPVEDVKVWHTDGNGDRSDEIITINSTNGTTQLFEIPISCSDFMDDFLIEVIRTEDEEEGMYTIFSIVH